jgi:hypothetical protein
VALNCDTFAYSVIIFFADSAACGPNYGRVVVLMCLLAVVTTISNFITEGEKNLRVFCYNRSCWSVVLQS